MHGNSVVMEIPDSMTTRGSGYGKGSRKIYFVEESEYQMYKSERGQKVTIPKKRARNASEYEEEYEEEENDDLLCEEFIGATTRIGRDDAVFKKLCNLEQKIGSIHNGHV